MTVAVDPDSLPAHELVYKPDSLPKLRSNHGDYLNNADVGFLRETTNGTPLKEMRRRFDEDGYVFIKNLLPREDVLGVREAYFAHLAPTGILKPGTTARQGFFDMSQDPLVHNGVGGTDLPESLDRVEKLEGAHLLPAYLELLKHPNLRGFVREFMGWKKDILIKRTLLRHNVPNGLSTGIHYDQIFLRAGESDFLTAWVPIGDCKAIGGGLMYLEQSDDIGRATEQELMKRAETLTEEERIDAFNVNMARDGQLAHDAKQFTSESSEGRWGGSRRPRRWLVGDFEAGDAVFHNPYMVHGAVKNEDPDGVIRLSTDLRFYEAGSSMDERWMRDTWRPDDGL